MHMTKKLPTINESSIETVCKKKIIKNYNPGGTSRNEGSYVSISLPYPTIPKSARLLKKELIQPK